MSFGVFVHPPIMLAAHCIVIALALSVIPLASGAADVALEPDARWQLEFPDLPDTLATMTTGERQPARLTVRLPANYSRDGKFSLFVFLNGGDGGRGDTLPLDRKTVGSNDFICVHLPLFHTNRRPALGSGLSTGLFEAHRRCAFPRRRAGRAGRGRRGCASYRAVDIPPH